LLEASPARETPAVVAPPPEPEAATPPARYWVEYGVYIGARSAKRLQQALAERGLDTVIVPTHRPDGRPLLRVRSSQPLDYGAAKAASAEVRRALKLSALIHRGSPLAPPSAVARNLERPSVSRSYWVQFGAFPHRPQAVRLQEQLARGGVETAVWAMRGTSGRTLYRVRSLTLPDRDSAMAVATRAREAGNTDFLVGQSIARPDAVIDPDRTENDRPIDRVPYRAAESMTFPAH
jgi:cell division protein FtsN